METEKIQYQESLKGNLKDPKFNLRPKDTLRASIKHKGYKPLFVNSSEHSDNKKSKIRKKQSVNPSVLLKPESKERKPKSELTIYQKTLCPVLL